MAGPQAGSSASEEVVLGIDPGLRVCGWGVVTAGRTPALVECGVIRPPTREPMTRRLLALHEAVAEIIARHRPSEVAIEDPFVGSVAPASALAIGQARAAALLAAARAGLEVSFYAPAAVKLAVTGYGRGDKAQVAGVVRLLLSLEVAPQPSDASDALAVALCHLQQRRARVLARSPRR